MVVRVKGLETRASLGRRSVAILLGGVLCEAVGNVAEVLRSEGGLGGGYDGLGVAMGESLCKTEAAEVEGLEDHLEYGMTLQCEGVRLWGGCARGALLANSCLERAHEIAERGARKPSLHFLSQRKDVLQVHLTTVPPKERASNGCGGLVLGRG